MSARAWACGAWLQEVSTDVKWCARARDSGMRGGQRTERTCVRAQARAHEPTEGNCVRAQARVHKPKKSDAGVHVLMRGGAEQRIGMGKISWCSPIWTDQ